MGNNIELDKRYWTTAAFQEQFIRLGNILSTLHIYDYNDRVPIGITNTDILPKLVPEFNIINKPGRYIELHRKSYLAPDELCCINDDRYAWVTDNNIISSPSFNNSLYTCHPSTIAVGENNICDDVLYNNCLLNKNINIYGKCTVWLDGVLKRYRTSSDMVNKTNNYMTSQCNYDINNHVYCKHWLSSIRRSGNPDFEYIADLIITNQINKNDFKCAFPPDYILKKNNILEPLECWYRECALSENWKLLTKNITIKNNCNLTDCNIAINSLNITADVDINAICNAAIIKRNSLEQSTILRNDAKFNEFPILSNVFIFLLCSLFILYVCLCINSNNNNI